MSYATEPAHHHGRPARVGVLLVNLGTPEAPTPAALRRYLGEFLSDTRVVEIPRLIWWPILHGIILRVRPKKSAAKYASVWTPQGSPLASWTAKQSELLKEHLGLPAGSVVRHAMRYGQPSVGSQLDALKAEGCDRILILPLYPQYSATTSASVFDAVYAWAGKVRRVPELRFINRYGMDADYINALALKIEAHWQQHGRADKLVMSFHGVPERTLHLGDPYHCECHQTARRLAERLGLAAQDWQLTFQSRFGKAKWLEPYTEPTLQALAKQGVPSVQVVCPGFVADCLETLEEVAMECRTAFLTAGGQRFEYIPCLNDDPAWIGTLAKLVSQHTQGWWGDALSVEERQAGRERALAAGAQD
ncbi:ferrochelatase [Leptothrix ochracea]|uniref:ferrochelatase n=2 Tax=Leptothrix ochracea TaxID=735331 RepID=UPI0034E2B104